MEAVSLNRDVEADPDDVRAAMAEVVPFMSAGGFDEVEIEGDRVHLRNSVGLLTIELELRRLPDAEAAVAYEQVEGIFRAMETRFEVTPI